MPTLRSWACKPCVDARPRRADARQARQARRHERIPRRREGARRKGRELLIFQRAARRLMRLPVGLVTSAQQAGGFEWPSTGSIASPSRATPTRLRSCWALCGADWEARLRRLLQTARHIRRPEFRQINEMGEVPVLEHEESAAVPVGRHPRLPGGPVRPIRLFSRRGSAARDIALAALGQPQAQRATSGRCGSCSGSRRPRRDPGDRVPISARVTTNLQQSSTGHLEERAFVTGARADHRRRLDLGGYLYFEAGRVRRPPGPDSIPGIGAWLDRIKALPGWVHPYELMPGHPLPA